MPVRDSELLDPVSLPAWLAQQAVLRPHAVALRHKRLGIWHALTWQQLARSVNRQAAALARHGVDAGATVVLLSLPRPEALLLALAAQTLGAVAAPLDPLLPKEALQSLLVQLQPAFVFAEDQAQVDLVLEALPEPALLAYADERGLGQYRHPALISCTALEAAAPREGSPRAGADEAAFAFYRLHGAAVELQQFSHRQLLLQAHHLVSAERLGAHDEALVARGFATGSTARYLLASWLVAGFALNFPENLATRDHDRRELGPTLVLGTRETYARVAAMARARLPRPGSLLRRLVDRALAAGSAGLPGYWLVRRPLREVLGFARLRSPLLVGAALDAETDAFFRALGIAVHPWDEVQEWSAHDATERLGARPHTYLNLRPA
ncbi:MAG: AMP-binding protein [Gammaproteobacteria bacterium]